MDLWKEDEGVSLREKEALKEGMESVKNKKMLAVRIGGGGFIVTGDGWCGASEGEEGAPSGSCSVDEIFWGWVVFFKIYS